MSARRVGHRRGDPRTPRSRNCQSARPEPSNASNRSGRNGSDADASHLASPRYPLASAAPSPSRAFVRVAAMTVAEARRASLPKHYAGDESSEEEEPKHKGGNVLTRELIRKRSEHNEGVISTLEELTLHQEELVAIAPCLGQICRKLKILYLQNNIISKMENLHHLKDVEYLNLALNNISKIEGVGKCEFLNKLDLTVNFVDVDALEESMDNLASRDHLKDLYMMGNPAQVDWPGFKNYVIARLPQLKFLDGEAITRGMRIVADQQLPKLSVELRTLAAAKAAEKAGKAPVDMDALDVDEAAPYTPEVRVKMYEEVAEQKAEKEAKQNHMKPKDRDFDKEQAKAVAKARAREEDGKIQQCNQGKWDFHWDEESKPGHVVLEVHVQRHLDSSLIDLDVHPTYVSVVIKSKTLRLVTPAEVRASDAKAQRSKTTGHLVVTMPKVDANGTALFIKPKAKARRDDRLSRLENGASKVAPGEKLPPPRGAGPAPLDNRAAVPTASIGSIGAMVLDDAKRPAVAQMAAVSTTRKTDPPPPPAAAAAADADSDEEPPPLV